MTRRGVSQQETSHRVENKGPKRDCDLSTATLRFTLIPDFSALLQIVDTSFLGVAATRPNTALALLGRARPAGHPAARIAA